MSEPETRYAYTSVAPAASSAEGSAMPTTPSSTEGRATSQTVGVIGRGRAGTALAAALRAAGTAVDGPLGRGAGPAAETVLLCVPDAEIAAAAAALVAGHDSVRFVGHVSGATPLSALEPARRAGVETFGLHPLQTFSGDGEPSLAGVGCAIAGSSSAALILARGLAERLGMRAFEIDDDRRASYHAAASIASNFLVTLEGMAEAVAANAGFPPDEARELLAPLVRRTVSNWAARGPHAALTGPVARGDASTVDAHRIAVSETDPALLPLFDALVERTQALAAGHLRASQRIAA